MYVYKRRVSEGYAQPINAGTCFCAVYGWPIKHSASPALQNAGMAALGLNWRYLAFEVHPDNLRAAIAGAKAMRFIGLNLTVPHKLLAMDMVDALDESAKTWGAVNTIRFEARDAKGTWRALHKFTKSPPSEIRSHGFNTDAEGFSQALCEDLGLKPKGAQALVLGTGGAGRVAALKLASENIAALFLVNRTQSKARALAEEIRKKYPQLKVVLGYPKDKVDLIVNGTSLGLKPQDPLPINEKLFPLHQAKAVYDMIYRPAETDLLRAAKTAGCRTANGVGMLLFQGVKALEIWTGKRAPVAVMRKALEKNVYGR